MTSRDVIIPVWVAYRGAISLALAGAVGVVGTRLWAFPSDNPFLALLQLRTPMLFAGLKYLYITLWFSTPFLALSVLTSLLTVAALRRERPLIYSRLPPYPSLPSRVELSLVLGELHHPTQPVRVAEPSWLTIPRRGLHTGVFILGAVGTGKTSACMYPYVEQLLAWRPDDPTRKVGGLILEVKGDFCAQVRAILTRHGRADDYVEIGLDSIYCYNPLHNDLDPYALAYSIAMLLNNLFGKGKEPFWQQAYTDLLKFTILLRKLVDGYTTLAEVYRYIIEEGAIERDLARGDALLNAQRPNLQIDAAEYHLAYASGSRWSHWTQASPDRFVHAYAEDLADDLRQRGIAFTLDGPVPDAAWADRRHQLDAVNRWYFQTWSRLEPRLKSSIVEGIVVFLSLFDDNPQVFRAFCPPKNVYTDPANTGRKHSTPLPPIDELLEQGKVLALNFPASLNPGLSRALGVLLKMDFQRAVLGRIPKIAAAPERPWRDLVFVCDEYHSFATTGDTDPGGDERTFALSRQARLIPIVATQSISSLRSAVQGEESWRTLLQCFRTKIFLSTADEFTARVAAELCGKAERLKPSYQLAEAGQRTGISWLTGRATSDHATVTTSKSYAWQYDFVFQAKVFTELQNNQAIVLPYDGESPGAPTYCYLKPHFLDRDTSYFDHAARGTLYPSQHRRGTHEQF